VATDSSGSGQLPGAGTRVHGDGLADNEAIVDELADGLAGVCVGDLVHLIGVKPDLALSATDNGRREALLRAEIDPRGIERQYHLIHSGCARGVERSVRRGVIATLEAHVQRSGNAGELWSFGLMVLAGYNGAEGRNSYILDGLMCRRRWLLVEEYVPNFVRWEFVLSDVRQDWARSKWS